MLARAVADQPQHGLADDVEPQQLSAVLEEDRLRRRRAPLAPELAKEAKALARGQNVVPVEKRHLDFPERQILGCVGQDRRAGGERHRPTLREVSAGVRRAYELDEAVAAGRDRDEA